MIKFQAVIIEDNRKVIKTLKRRLPVMGCEVAGVSFFGEEGYELVRTYKPQIVIIDIVLEDGDRKGFEVAQRIRKNFPETKIIMITGHSYGAEEAYKHSIDYFVKKNESLSEESGNIFTYVQTAMNLSRFPINDPEEHYYLSIRYSQNQPISIRLNNSQHVFSNKNFSHDLNSDIILNDILELIISTNKDIPRISFHGKKLYKELIQDYREIYEIYLQIASTRNSNIHFSFETDRNLSNIPFEMIHDNKHFWAIKHPVKRNIVTDLYRRRQGINPEFFYKISSSSQKIKILLVASNTGNIPDVDREINSLAEGLNQKLRYNLSFHIKKYNSEDADFGSIVEELEKGEYDIFHYAGHGYHDQESPDDSCISFWSQKERKGIIRYLTARKLSLLLEDTKLKFIYLSCCYSGNSSPQSKLVSNEFLGFAEGLLTSGVPAVLGYRWPVSDSNASLFAQEFYKSLLSQGNLDSALLSARKVIYRESHFPTDALAPILWTQ